MTSIPYDGIVTFLAFLIGIPALVLQTMTPEVRRAVMQHPNKLLAWAGLSTTVAILIVIATAFIIDQIIPPSQSTAVASSPAIFASLIASEESSPDTFERTRNLVWAIAIGGLFFITVFAAFVTTRNFGQREPIITEMKNRALKPLKKQARLDEKALSALIELGKQSSPGEDKYLVLTALNELVDQVCRHPAYNGDALETMITRLDDILSSDTQPGTSPNFNTAAEMLQRIVIATAGKPRQVDLTYAIRATNHLSHAAMNHIASQIESENTLMNCVESLGLAFNLCPDAAMEVSEALFKVGAVAIEQQQDLVAVTALNNLLTLVQANQPARGELVADMLGLTAHFWVAGPTAREYVLEKLGMLKPQLAVNLRDALESARKHCMQTMFFQTADHLTKMTQDLYNPQN